MRWKHAGILIVCLFIVIPSQGQTNKFSFSHGISSADYENGTVWVKVKTAYRDIFLNSRSGGRSLSLPKEAQIEPLVAQKSRNKSAVRLAPRKLQTDISRYFKLRFEKDYPVEDYINELYATGYFDLVEPVYVHQTLFTPNDPAIGSQYYINLVKANEAWDITQGDPSIVIGIVDTGGDLDHPDLQNNIYIDPADPTDGIDNDGDGYVDNNRGWDFSGADIALIGTPGFQGDNNPSVISGNKFGHGTMVAGCASATTNDGVGISGIGFNTKLLFTKHFADNQPDNSTSYSSNLYEGVLYAALHGAKIINCSWGNPNSSGIAQDIINYVTLDLGCLVVAAAGNSNSESPLYPAAYDNVLSVASSDENDLRSWFSNYGNTVDIIAPGSNIYTTNYDNGYRSDSGTSLSAPLVAGAAALVWAHHPEYTPLQVAEQLRISADETFYLNSPGFEFKLGKGRLDIAQALTFVSPSVRARNQVLVNDAGELPGPGESATLFYDFTNYLASSSPGLTVTITSSSPYLIISQGEFATGTMSTHQTVSNVSNPFKLIFATDAPIDQPVEALLTFADGAYHDTQLVSFVMPSFIDINENNITTTATSTGRIGFTNAQGQNNGSGFVYNNTPLLFEMGLIMGTSVADISDNVRAASGVYNQDLIPTSKIQKFTPGERSFSEVTTSFQNAPLSESASLSISFRSMVWRDDPFKNFVILEYKIKNTTSNPVANFHMGIFADWDIASNGGSDRASWDADTRLGYVFPAQPSTLPRAGIQVLSGEANYYAIDNDHTISGNPLGLYDGFSDEEKYATLSNGLARFQAGGVNGGDVSHVVSSGPYVIPANEEITIAFALHGAGSLNELINSAKYADTLYNYTFNAAKPIVGDVEVCYSNDAALTAEGASKFNWYREKTGGSPVSSASELTIPDLLKDTILYVSNAEKSYESLRSTVSVKVMPNPTIVVSAETEFCEGGSVILTATEGEKYTWNTGTEARDLEVTHSGSYTVTVDNGTIECTSLPVDIIVHPLPTASFTVSAEDEGDGYLARLSNESAGATAWLWNFGDGNTSVEKDPNHLYETKGDYTITLTSTSADGCEGSESRPLGPITGVEIPLETAVKLYPNPVYDEQVIISHSRVVEPLDVHIFSSQGRLLHRAVVAQDSGQHVLSLSGLPSGIYYFHIKSSTETVVRKIVIGFL